MKLTAPRRGPGRSLESTASVLAVLATIVAVVAVLAARVVWMAAPASPSATLAPTTAAGLSPTQTNLPLTWLATAIASPPVTDPAPALEPTAFSSPLPLASAEAQATVAGATQVAVVPPTSSAGPLPSATVAAATLAPTAPLSPPTPIPPTAIPPTDLPPTPAPSATLPVAPLTIIRDQACLQPELNRLYIFGELENQTDTAYDIYAMRPRVFGGAGEVNVLNQWFDLPGDYYVAPATTLPFVVIAQLEVPEFSHYEIDLTVEPTTRGLRSDLTITEFNATPDDNQVEVTGLWTHTGPQPANFVSIVATAHDGEGRVANMSYLYLTHMTSITPGLPEGQHTFDLYLPASPCGDGTISVSILGE